MPVLGGRKGGESERGSWCRWLSSIRSCRSLARTAGSSQGAAAGCWLRCVGVLRCFESGYEYLFVRREGVHWGVVAVARRLRWRGDVRWGDMTGRAEARAGRALEGRFALIRWRSPSSTTGHRRERRRPSREAQQRYLIGGETGETGEGFIGVVWRPRLLETG